MNAWRIGAMLAACLCLSACNDSSERVDASSDLGDCYVGGAVPDTSALANPRFVAERDGAGTVTDLWTTRVWAHAVPGTAGRTYADCDALNLAAYGGASDWRDAKANEVDDIGEGCLSVGYRANGTCWSESCLQSGPGVDGCHADALLFERCPEHLGVDPLASSNALRTCKDISTGSTEENTTKTFSLRTLDYACWNDATPLPELDHLCVRPLSE